MSTENTPNHIELTAAEISSLWSSYQEHTLNLCGINFFLVHVNDSQIRQILEKALTIEKNNKAKLEQFFNNENYPVPQGFTEQDVNLNAPRLLSDKLYLEYILNMAELNLFTNATALTMAARSDIIDFYSNKLNIAQGLLKQAVELAKQKGTYVRTPSIPKAKKIDFVKKERFLTGWFGDRRPLLGVEIANLAYASKRNALGQAVITAFSQVAENKETRQYFEKGRDIAGKHKEAFNDILNEDYLSNGMLMTSEVTDSTVAPFSDKFMMNFVTILISFGITQYLSAISESQRHDLGVTYTRLMAEIVKYSNEGANIMIENGWMEQPPIAADRKGLAKR